MCSTSTSNLLASGFNVDNLINSVWAGKAKHCSYEYDRDILSYHVRCCLLLTLNTFYHFLSFLGMMWILHKES